MEADPQTQPSQLDEQHSIRKQPQPQSQSPSSSSSSCLLTDSEPEPEPEHRGFNNGKNEEELRHMVLAPSALFQRRKKLTKQLSLCETPRDAAWEKRRRQFQLSQKRRRNGVDDTEQPGARSMISDEDLHELKGCIDLGFGFNEEDGQGLTNTLPALDLYFAVNRQFSPSPVSTPSESSSGHRSSSFTSPKSESDWKICNPGDDPQQVKTKLRHWAQAVACSVKQSY